MEISKKLLGISLIPLTLFVVGAVVSAVLIRSSSNATSRYISYYVERQVLTLDIYRKLGYGQGIHSFKNYILRYDEKYKKAALEDMNEAKTLIHKYLQFESLSSEERSAMKILLATVNMYAEKIPIAELMIKKGKSISSIDQAVKVDDTPAMTALQDLHSYFIRKRDLELENLKTVQNEVFLVAITTFTVSILFALLVSKIISSKMLLSIKRLLRVSSEISEGKFLIREKTVKEGLSEDELTAVVTQMVQMGKKLDQSFESLKRSNEELEDFAFIASHDLQEPVKKISAYADFLREDYGERLDQEGLEYVVKIKDLTGRMINLIKSLLEYSRLVNLKTEFEKVDLNEVVRSSMDNLELLIKEKNATVHCDRLPIVNGNRALLQSLFQNLISNAVKFQKPDSTAVVYVSAKRDGNCWNISVKDNGIGFNVKHQDRMFKPFGRLYSKGQYPGSGIGLATCRKIIEAHDSKFEVESVENVGSTFAFSLESSV